MDRAVWVRTLATVIELCFWARQLDQCLSPPREINGAGGVDAGDTAAIGESESHSQEVVVWSGDGLEILLVPSCYRNRR